MSTKTLIISILILALITALPCSAQSVTELKKENSRLKAQIQTLTAQGCTSSNSPRVGWANGALSATIDSIRVGQNSNNRTEQDGNVTITITLHNTGNRPIALSYQSGSFRLVDEAGRVYTLRIGVTVSGIPTARNNTVDPSASISPGGSRSITFSPFRIPTSGDSLGRRFDMNATFIQLEESEQGEIRKVRDYPVAFTNVPASGRGF